MVRWAKTRHAGRANSPFSAHTEGGEGVRAVCLLSSLLGRVVGICAPAARLCGGVGHHKLRRHGFGGPEWPPLCPSGVRLGFGRARRRTKYHGEDRHLKA